eukprot:SAG31_NODE_182_length_21094_cov_4.426721_10_plen_38_part_00
MFVMKFGLLVLIYYYLKSHMFKMYMYFVTGRLVLVLH